MRDAVSSAQWSDMENLTARQQNQFAPDISSLFPDGVLTLVEHRDNWPSELAPAERRQLGEVCEKRLAEFSAGRSQARRLISVLTGTAEPLLAGNYRQPLWPADITGSISHSDDFCAVAVAAKSTVADLGIDVETFEALDPEVVDIVLTPTEIAATGHLDGWTRKLMFSIKESNYKCCYHRVNAFIDFKQCEITLDLKTCSYMSTIVCNNHTGMEMCLHVKGRWLVESNHIFTSAYLA